MTSTDNRFHWHIAAYLNGCPAPWIKFVKTVNPTGNTERLVDQELRKRYRARLENHVVIFASKEDFMMFLMNWS